ncbi:S8 family peptidase [Bosea vaviloviae]|nr:S8 family peptidase [Bosea vaviloviae]
MQSRIKGRRKFIPPRPRSFDEQAKNLTPGIALLRQSVEADVTRDPAFASPERALVFETIGPVEKFIAAAAALGFEWLTEDYVGAEPDPVSGGPSLDAAPTNDMSRLYLTMPTEAGMRKLLAMWGRYERDLKPAEGEEVWWKVFGYLKTIRVWNATDRIEPATQRFIQRRLAQNPQGPVRLEIDLWFRHDEALRKSARASLESILAAVGGRILDFVTIEEIRYQVALIEVPADGASQIQERVGSVSNADAVMAIRPQSMFTAEPGGRFPIDGSLQEIAPPQRLRPAVAAILDGYPMQNHSLLADRVEVVEVDVKGTEVPVARRFHGTAIASLILHGDLPTGEETLSRGLKAVPVLAAPQHLNDERTQEDLLPIGIIHRAVLALKQGVNGQEPAGPDVLIINHSLCDAETPYIRRPTAWARLLDMLSHKFGVLFVVSAGNIQTEFLSGFTDDAAFKAAIPVSRQIALLRAVEASKGHRSLLSPAEAMNVITVGAVHADDAEDSEHDHIDPFSLEVTNLASAIGPGINRSLKPEIVESGGRQFAGSADRLGGHRVWPEETGHAGLEAACPDPISGSISKTIRSTGTSNAAALVTRSGVKIIDALEDVLTADGSSLRNFKRAHLATKALLVHGAKWGSAGTLLDAAYPPPGSNSTRRRRGTITKFLGYGRPFIDRVISGAANRITLLADDQILPEHLHEYRVPIPVSMIKSREVRRITMTLTWSPPIHPTSIAYRGAMLDIVDAQGQRKFWKGVKNTLQPHPDDTRRGTTCHFVLEGSNRTPFSDQNGLFIGVQARSLNKDFEPAQIPYALAITLEVGANVQEDIYTSVSQAIRPRPRVTP